MLLRENIFWGPNLGGGNLGRTPTPHSWGSILVGGNTSRFIDYFIFSTTTAPQLLAYGFT